MKTDDFKQYDFAELSILKTGKIQAAYQTCK